MYKAMERNGSPKPELQTDAQSTYFLATLPAHPLVEINEVTNEANSLHINDLYELLGFIKDELTSKVTSKVTKEFSEKAASIVKNEIHDKAIMILQILTHWMKRGDLFERVQLSNQSTNNVKYLEPLLDLGLVEMEYPETPTHRSQRYKASPLGTALLKIIENT
jgi:ATP-dependent DNA helicase RecG